MSPRHERLTGCPAASSPSVALVCAGVLFAVLRPSPPRDDTPSLPTPTPTPAADPDTGDIVVAPSDDDDAAGTEDAPFATLQRAQQEARGRRPTRTAMW